MTDDPPRIPVQTELTVLEAKPADRTIKFSVYEEMGSPIWLVPKADLEGKSDLDEDWLDQYKVLTEGGIKTGDRILVATLFGYSWGVVQEGQGGTLHAMGGEHTMFPLEFRERVVGPPCWTCSGSINTRGLQRLSIYKEDPDE